MKARLKSLFETFRTDFWPLPTTLALLALILAETSLWIDSKNPSIFEEWFNASSAEALRAILMTAAGGTLTLAGLVFSSTLVALTLASSQLGPRLLHNFIRARCNQVTLGMLLGNFIFSLVVLRETNKDFLPHFSVSSAFFLTLASLGTFIYFVHHLVRSLQAGNAVAQVADSLQRALEKNFPDRANSSAEEREAESDLQSWEDLKNEQAVSSRVAGYLQLIDYKSLVESCEALNCRVRIFLRPGRPLLEGTRLFAFDSEEELTSKQQDRLRRHFVVGKVRTTEQDFEFSLRQLVEVAMRSLSPGINDPFTAINCIDLLAISMGKIANRNLQQNTYYDKEGVPRVRLRPLSFRNLLNTSFLQIRHDGSGRADVMIRLLEALLLLLEQTRNEEQRKAVEEMARLVLTESKACIDSEFDVECLETTYQRIREFSEG